MKPYLHILCNAFVRYKASSDVLNIKLPIPKDLQKQNGIGREVEKRRSEAKRLRSQAEAVVTAAKARVERMILGEDTMD